MRRAVLLLGLLLGQLAGATEAPAMPPPVSSDPVIARAVGAAAGNPAARLARLIDQCEGDTYRAVRVLFGCDGFWDKQIEVCRSIDQYDTTLVPAGNSVGKSYMGGRIGPAFLLSRRNSIVFTTSPTQNQLESILWKEVRSAVQGMPIPLGAEVRGSGPIELKLSHRWYMTGHVSNKVESTTGHHAEHLLVMVDEGSGVSEATYEAAWSLNPSRVVVFGNPLKPSGRFYELCRKAEAERVAEENGGPRRTSNLIRIPSTASPHIHLDRSPFGLADQGFLRRSARDYGKDSLWWQAHVDAIFPETSAETAVPEAWIKLACATIHTPGGARRLSIDVAGGNGGDEWVIIARDANGILDLQWSATWSTEEAAAVAGTIARGLGIPGHHVTFDAGGLGWDFANRLAAAGLPGAIAYLGGAGADGYPNVRSACAQLARFRLDPGYKVQTAAGLYVPQVPFSFNPARPDWHAKLAEIGLFLRFLKGDAYALELSREIRERLKRSPDTGDAFFQSFFLVLD